MHQTIDVHEVPPTPARIGVAHHNPPLVGSAPIPRIPNFTKLLSLTGCAPTGGGGFGVVDLLEAKEGGGFIIKGLGLSLVNPGL